MRGQAREWYPPVKRLMDVLGSAAGLIALAPIIGLVALMVRISLGRPVFFTQERPGKDERPFRLVKFRTMRPALSTEVWFRSDDVRLTKIGRLVRKLSLDELPTLWNVLKGDMSLVGPRPLLMEYLPKYTPEQNRRHEVRPGITGWAQVHGRQTVPFSKRLEFDIWYVDHMGLSLDIKVLFKTVWALIRPTGVLSGQNVDEVDDLGLSPDREPKRDRQGE